MMNQLRALLGSASALLGNTQIPNLHHLAAAAGPNQWRGPRSAPAARAGTMRFAKLLTAQVAANRKVLGHPRDYNAMAAPSRQQRRRAKLLQMKRMGLRPMRKAG